MLTETRDMLSLALYLADTASCTTQGLEKKPVLASLIGFVVSLLNIVL